jgi:hypothetical protein
MRTKTGVTFLLIGSMQLVLKSPAVDLEPCLSRAIANKVYQSPSREERARAQELFVRTLQGHDSLAELAIPWSALGFEFKEVTTPEETLWLLSEPAGKESGRGWYLFRTNHQSSVALEMPHARNDIHTGMIGLRMFLTGQARVLAASTITRHRADMAHLDDTFFQAFTLAFAQVCPTGLVVQLHGFEAGNHDTVKADIIASAGSRSPSPWLADLVQRLRKVTNLPVLAYPEDTRVLGATLNAQGRALQPTPSCRFVHLEMCLEFRERLTRDDKLRRAIFNCLSAMDSR